MIVHLKLKQRNVNYLEDFTTEITRPPVHKKQIIEELSHFTELQTLQWEYEIE